MGRDYRELLNNLELNPNQEAIAQAVLSRENLETSSILKLFIPFFSFLAKAILPLLLAFYFYFFARGI